MILTVVFLSYKSMFSSNAPISLFLVAFSTRKLLLVLVVAVLMLC